MVIDLTDYTHSGAGIDSLTLVSAANYVNAANISYIGDAGFDISVTETAGANGGLVLSVAVPESGRYALLTGLLSLGFVMVRRSK